MKHRSNEIALVIGGILLGATLATPVAGTVLTAQESMQQIYVDGKLAQMEAYSISGHNYCKLRDSGSATVAASDEERTALMNAVAAISAYPAYDASDDGDTVTVYAKHPSAYAEAAEICRRFIGGLAAKTSGLQSKIRQNPNQIFLPLVKPFPLDFRVLSEYCLCRERM
jgi:hypothetical protein